MAVIQLDRVSIHTFEKPPSDFRLMEATPQQLRRHGFPPRPDDPTMRAAYDGVMRRLAGKLQWIEPTFEVLADRGHGLNRRSAGLQTGPNWSGVVVYAPANDSVASVAGSWVVPNVSPSSQKKNFYSCHWVGIDGDNTQQLLQAGVECDVTGGGDTSFYAWYEWLPDNATQVKISSMKIEPGDYVTVLICTESGAGSTQATIYFTNSTSGKYLSFVVTAANSAIQGRMAEWVSEITEINSVIDADTLADFGEVYFGDCIAGTVKSGLLNVMNGDQLEMLDSAGVEKAIGIPITSTVVRTAYMGLPGAR